MRLSHFMVRKPCNNCPFRKEGAIELRPGRLESIVGTLMANDRVGFPCHKTTHCLGGDEDDEGNYIPSGREKECAGALVYRIKAGNPPVWARLFAATGRMDLRQLELDLGRFIIDPFTKRNLK